MVAKYRHYPCFSDLDILILMDDTIEEINRKLWSEFLH